ncbi:MAG TPA: thioredoxin family protein [Fimbriimonadaceae bacterium]|nr:thioredoxin family protein [Fimbriimonadaceae bacterium]
MRRIATFIATLLPIISFAQIPDFGGKAQVEKIKALNFLVGRWEGEAWVHAQGRKIPVTGFEDVQLQAGGTCLMINAIWKMKAGEREIPIHEPCAMLYWDASKNEYRMLAQLGNGLRNEFKVEVKPRGFVWYLTMPSVGEVRYTMNLTEDGVWHEIGEHKMADGKWEPTLEMKLKKSGTTTVERKKFDPKADATKDIANGVEKAKAEGKRVLLDVGGEWCGWCHKLDALFASNTEIAEILAKRYVIVKVNFSPENKNEAVLSKYPKINGYPHLFVLDAEGKLLHSQDTGLLETGPNHDPAKVIEFLKKWG